MKTVDRRVWGQGGWGDGRGEEKVPWDKIIL